MPGSDVDSPVNLDTFVENHRGRKHRRWVDCLPDDVVAQIMASDAGEVVVARWLVAIGYEDATPHRVKVLTRARS